MNPIDDLAKVFAQFPGIGERQSKRFVYYLLRQSSQSIKDIAQKMEMLHKRIAECVECHRYFIEQNALKVCTTCDDRKSATTLLLIEKDADYDSIMRSGVYDGLFFVLGGLIPILEKNPERRVRLGELKSKLLKEKMQLKEIILAMSATREGEYTDEYLRKFVSEIIGDAIPVHSLGRGLSTGTELEYSDSETIISALKNRA